MLQSQLASIFRKLLSPEFGFGELQDRFYAGDVWLCDVHPSETIPISLTGKNCKLKCAHCNGHYLSRMRPLTCLTEGRIKLGTSILLSGGSDEAGKVPIDAEQISGIPLDIPLNVHVGFQGPDTLTALNGRNVTISFDLIGDRETISDVFGLKISPAEIFEMYLGWASIFPTVPHVTLGLRGGKLSGERKVFEFLRKHPPKALTLLVFRPTPNTPYSGQDPPDLGELAELFFRCVHDFPGICQLGCMRPAGNYRLELDILAWWLGVRTIVQPHPKLLKALRSVGVPVEQRKECCSWAR